MFLWVYFFCIVLLTLAYTRLIIFIHHHWEQIPIYNPASFQYSPVSVLIPARNEEDNILKCVRSFLACDFPNHMLEIIVIDDHSEDKTKSVIKAINDPRIRLLDLRDWLGNRTTNQYKKEAIRYGLSEATYDTIFQTDADITVKPSFLKTMITYFKENKLHFVTAPVSFSPLKSTFEKFQALDLIGMMGVTAAGIKSGKWFLANGANMMFQKEEYRIEEDFGLASGDDVHLINSIAGRQNSNVSFLKSSDAIAYTRPVRSLRSFINQRMRWGSKNFRMKGYYKWVISAIPYLVAMSVIIQLSLLPFYPWPVLLCLALQVSMLGMVNYVYLRSLTGFFNGTDLLQGFFFAQVMEILYLSIIGSASLVFKEYKWKGRKVR